MVKYVSVYGCVVYMVGQPDMYWLVMLICIYWCIFSNIDDFIDQWCSWWTFCVSVYIMVYFYHWNTVQCLYCPLKCLFICFFLFNLVCKYLEWCILLIPTTSCALHEPDETICDMCCSNKPEKTRNPPVYVCVHVCM